MHAGRTLEDVVATLRRQTHLDIDHHPLEIAVSGDGVLTLTGTVPDLPAKRLAVRDASAVPGVTSVVDHLALPPTGPAQDGAIRVHVRDVLLGDLAFAEITVRERVKGETVPVRVLDGARGEVCIDVDDGTVALRGTMPSLSHRRLAEALAWRVPGTRNVLVELEVTPPEADDDGELADALMLVLEADRAVEPAALTIHVEDGVITLRGWVRSEAERAAAERDAWSLDGVRGVTSELRVARPA